MKLAITGFVWALLTACSPGILSHGNNDGGGRSEGRAGRELGAGPDLAGQLPEQPASAPDRAAPAPDSPAGVPDGPGAPDKPQAAPDKPQAAPDKPQAAPDKPQAAPDKPAITGGPTIAGCPVFPTDNAWNTDISADPVDPSSASIIGGLSGSLHPDFSSTQGYNPPYGAGIPYVVVSASQPKVCVEFTYATESDPGPYPIPPDAPVEGGPNSGGDQHVLVIDKDSCKLYETSASSWNAAQSCWDCDAGALFDLSSNALRPDCWTSADAAGLPIFPGLVRYDEAVTAGEIKHAIRVTFGQTRQAFLHPATHFASTATGASLPPMGLRLRLKATYDISGFTGAARVVLNALKKYGLIVADNGSNWFISGAPDPSWDDNNLNTLKQVPGSAFEVVKMSGTLYTAADCP